VHPPAALWSHEPARLLGADVRVARIDRTGSDGFDVWVPPAAYGAVFEALVEAGAHPAGGRALESLRVEAGLPAWGHEYADTVIPLEVSGMEGITDRKGCYPGQEVVERLISLGRPPRQLVSLTLGAEAAPGAEVTAAGGAVGQVTSVAALPDGTLVALALVKRRAAEGDEALAVAGAEATRRTPRTGAG
jgi:folate-binding protein YgfZ